MSKMYKALSAAALSVMMLTSCGDTSAADKLIEQSEAAATTAYDESEDYLLYVPEPSKKSYAEGIDARNGDYDIDLTILNPTMTYSQVYDMVMNPDDYLGKMVRARGLFAYTTGTDENGNEKEYFAVIVKDATACCGQGIEFVLADERKYPEEYPPLDTEIAVSGRFNTYTEGAVTYCQLLDAVIES